MYEIIIKSPVADRHICDLATCVCCCFDLFEVETFSYIWLLWHAICPQVMGYHHVPSRPRETSSQALKIDMDAVRPDPTDVLEEYR